MTEKSVKLLTALGSLVIAHVTLAADLPPQSEPPFKGKIGLSAKGSVPDWPEPVKAPKGAPNIVLILIDDAGFAESSTFGGLAQTPTLDRLAAQGLRYNRFHVTAACTPTRAALLSGRNQHRVGFGSVGGFGSGYPGYNGIWPKSATPMAEILRRNGYSTAAFGKWDTTPPWELSPLGPFDRWPTGSGFEYFYGFGGGESQWEPALFRNTTPVEPPAKSEQGYHFTTDITADAISWVHTHQSLAPERPYFVYFAPGAIHAPLHVPKDWIEKYRGKFDRGWDKLREEIFARQKKLGVIPLDAELTPRPKELPAWDSLSAEEKTLQAHEMEVGAGFMAQTDYEIGRLVNAVQQGPGGDNTLVLYIAGDNGANGMAGPQGTDSDIPIRERLQQMDELGGPKHMNAYGAAWAWMASTPFQWMKLIGSHFGGTRDPLVASWPARIKDRGGVRSQFTHVTDIAPTIFEAAGIELPSMVDGVRQQKLDGVSFFNSFDNPQAPSLHRVQYFDNNSNRAIYKDGWVAAARHFLPWARGFDDDFENDRWELYHIDADFSEAHDLATKYPAKLQELQKVFDAEARANNVYPLGGKPFGGGPSVTENKKRFIYYPDLPRLPDSAMPDFSQSHRITADVKIAGSGAEGVIVTAGTRFGGFALFVKDNHVVYESNFFGRSHDVITSSMPVPRGKVKLACELTRDAAPGGGGVLRLYVNEQAAGELQLARIGAAFGTFNIGQARVSAVSDAYTTPFKFTGTIENVQVEMK